MEAVDECKEDIAESNEEMPLLFMDGLPSRLHQNADLAAIATFMDSTDEEADDEGEAFGSKQHRQRHDTSMTTSRRRHPYATLTPKNRNKKKRDKGKTSDTKELQLFLSMFHLS